MKLFLEKYPPTVDEAVEKLAAEMRFADRTRLANMDAAALIRFHDAYGIFIRTEFRLPGNEPLMQSCRSGAGLAAITPSQASYLIMKKLQERLLAGHALKVVK